MAGIRDFLVWRQKRRSAAATNEEVDFADALFAAAGGGRVDQEHVDRLLDRFRQRGMSPADLRTAEDLAAEIFTWQGDDLGGVAPDAPLRPGSGWPMAIEDDAPPQRIAPNLDVDTASIELETIEEGPIGRSRGPLSAASPLGATPTTRPSAPAPAARPPSLAAASPGGSGIRWSLLVKIALVLVVATVAYAVVPMFRDQPAVEVSGVQRLAHVGVSVDLADPWMHVPDFDQTTEKDGWKRSWSVFQRGVSATDFDAKLTVMTIVRTDGQPATATDARTIGASETAGSAVGRKCATTRRTTGNSRTAWRAWSSPAGVQPLRSLLGAGWRDRVRSRLLPHEGRLSRRPQLERRGPRRQARDRVRHDLAFDHLALSVATCGENADGPSNDRARISRRRDSRKRR